MPSWWLLVLASDEATRTADRRQRRPASAAPAVSRPAQPQTAALRSRGRRSGQVFGLAGVTDRSVSYWPSLPRPAGPVLDDGGRSHSPLRGSPGFAPGSLLPRPGWMLGRTSYARTISRESAIVMHHIHGTACRTSTDRRARRQSLLDIWRDGRVLSGPSLRAPELRSALPIARTV